MPRKYMVFEIYINSFRPDREKPLPQAVGEADPV